MSKVKLNEENTKIVKSGGISFAGALTVAFVVLKLLGIINWSWWWIVSPLWISAGIGLIVIIILLIILVILEIKERNDL